MYVGFFFLNLNCQHIFCWWTPASPIIIVSFSFAQYTSKEISFFIFLLLHLLLIIIRFLLLLLFCVIYLFFYFNYCIEPRQSHLTLYLWCSQVTTKARCRIKPVCFPWTWFAAAIDRETLSFSYIYVYIFIIYIHIFYFLHCKCKEVK